MKHWYGLCLLPWAVLTNACAPTPEELYEHSDTLSIRDWYRQSLGVEVPQVETPGTLPAQPSRDRLSRTVARAWEQDFVRLPNPALLLYVYPHFGVQRTPIPGYATRFFLFEQTPIRRNTFSGRIRTPEHPPLYHPPDAGEHHH